MESSRFSTSIDYNRTLAWPVRILHHSVAWAADHPVCSLLAAGLILTLALMPADLLITLAAKDLFASFPSDVRREVLALQQYGQVTFSLVIGIVILLLAPRQRARIWGWVVSSLFVFLSANALKILIARPRPTAMHTERLVGSLGPMDFVWLWGTVPEKLRDGGTKTLHAWSGVFHLESMPSRHSAFAAVCSVVLASLFPSLRWLVLFLMLIVMAARVLTGEHWASDTIAGAAIGAAITIAVMRRWPEVAPALAPV